MVLFAELSILAFYRRLSPSPGFRFAIEFIVSFVTIFGPMVLIYVMVFAKYTPC